MNLILEQRPTTITSKLQQQQQQRSNDVKNHFSSSSLVVKIKRQKNDQETPNLNSISSSMANEDNNQRLKRSTPYSSTTRRPSSPVFNGKQQSSKRSVVIDNNNNDLTPNIDENSSTKRFKQDDFNNKVDACVETVSIGLSTEPDQLGPCEPGTSVVLEGIVWNETDSGVLVVNVTWRGKTYVGTLLDSTKQDWACPRLTCESPTSDYDPRNSSKTSRTKRSNAGGNNRCSFQQISSTNLSSGSDDRKLRSSIKSRQSKRTNLTTIDETSSTTTTTTNHSSSSPLISPMPTNNTTFFSSSSSSSNNESQLIPCSESQCYKQFASTTALNYHLSNSHKKNDSISPVSIPHANTRDEEDVAHILANVADYVRRPSPRSSPDHQRQTTLTWPCPQISSNLVLSSSLNNNEQISINSTTRTNDELKSTVKQADHFLLHIQDEPSSWINTKNDRIIDNNNKKSTLKIPTPPPSSSSSSSFVPITINPTIQHPPISSSPAYSDISDEDSTIITNENEQISPSTINLLNEQQSIIPNTAWSTQILLQQYGSYMQQVNKELTSNCLNSKSNPNGTSDSTVKNILDSRGLSTTKSPSPTSSSLSSTTNDSLLNDYQKTLYHYSPNGITNDSKLSTPIMNSLTSPNENLLNPSNNTSR